VTTLNPQDDQSGYNVVYKDTGDALNVYPATTLQAHNAVQQVSNDGQSASSTAQSGKKYS
jgi:hypothetical protein